MTPLSSSLAPPFLLRNVLLSWAGARLEASAKKAKAIRYVKRFMFVLSRSFLVGLELGVGVLEWRGAIEELKEEHLRDIAAEVRPAVLHLENGLGGLLDAVRAFVRILVGRDDEVAGVHPAAVAFEI